jgi:proteic killer suppression protein
MRDRCVLGRCWRCGGRWARVYRAESTRGSIGSRPAHRSKSKSLAELWEKGRTGKIDIKIQTRILRRLDRLDVVTRPEEMPGFNFDPLRGFKPTRYSVHVNGPWCITFEFEDGDACRVDFEQYH